jgi:hypothetical protein
VSFGHYSVDDPGRGAKPGQERARIDPVRKCDAERGISERFDGVGHSASSDVVERSADGPGDLHGAGGVSVDADRIGGPARCELLCARRGNHRIEHEGTGRAAGYE